MRGLRPLRSRKVKRVVPWSTSSRTKAQVPLLRASEELSLSTSSGHPCRHTIARSGSTATTVKPPMGTPHSTGAMGTKSPYLQVLHLRDYSLDVVYVRARQVLQTVVGVEASPILPQLHQPPPDHFGRRP